MHKRQLECSVLAASLTQQQRQYYDKLQRMRRVDERCKNMAKNIFGNVTRSELKNIGGQFEVLGSCGSCNLNYKLAKIMAKIDEHGEEAAINYYMNWVEDDISRLVTRWERMKIFYSINKDWLAAVHFAAFGAGAGVARQLWKNRK